MTTQLPPFQAVKNAYERVADVSYYTRDMIEQLVAEGVPVKNARNQVTQRAKSFVKEPEAIFQNVEEYLRANPKFRLFNSKAKSYKMYLKYYRDLVKYVASMQQDYAVITDANETLQKFQELMKPIRNQERQRREAMNQLKRNLENIRNRGAATRMKMKENYETMRHRLYESESESNNNSQGNTVAPLTRYQSPYNKTLQRMKAYSNRRITNAIRQKKRGGKTRKTNRKH